MVKALNTLTAGLMVDPKQLGRSSTVFVSGDDTAAKATVTALLESFGHDDVIDLGDLSTARGTEMLLPIWLRLMGTPRHRPVQLQDRPLTPPTPSPTRHLCSNIPGVSLHE